MQTEHFLHNHMFIFKLHGQQGRSRKESKCHFINPGNYFVSWQNGARVLGKNTIITSSMISINYVLLHRAFHIGLKKIQVLRDRGGEFCFKRKTTSYCSCTRFLALRKFLLPCTNWKYEKLRKKALVIQFLSCGRNLCRGSATATSEIRLEQMYIVCDRRALGFYFHALLGYLRQSFQFDCERCSCMLRSLMLIWHI